MPEYKCRVVSFCLKLAYRTKLKWYLHQKQSCQKWVCMVIWHLNQHCEAWFTQKNKKIKKINLRFTFHCMFVQLQRSCSSASGGLLHWQNLFVGESDALIPRCKYFLTLCQPGHDSSLPPLWVIIAPLIVHVCRLQPDAHSTSMLFMIFVAVCFHGNWASMMWNGKRRWQEVIQHIRQDRRFTPGQTSIVSTSHCGLAVDYNTLFHTH